MTERHCWVFAQGSVHEWHHFRITDSHTGPPQVDYERCNTDGARLTSVVSSEALRVASWYLDPEAYVALRQQIADSWPAWACAR